MKYLLSVFIEHNEQELFVKSIGKEISTIASKSGVKYFFGTQTALFTFETRISFESIKNFFDSILSDLSITHILVPIKTDKMSYWFNKENEKHLFGTDLCNTNDEYSDEEQKNLMDDLFLGSIDRPKKPSGEWGPPPGPRGFSDKLYELFGKKKKVEEVPTLDELLDKINVSGMKSLTEKEKNLLKQYSN